MSAVFGNAIELTIPSDREMMLVVRLTAAGVLSKYRLDMDSLDDVKMAVEEACLALMRYANQTRLRIVFKGREDAVEFSVFAEGDTIQSIELIPDRELEVVKSILLSMIDEVQINVHAGMMNSIQMLKKLPD